MLHCFKMVRGDYIFINANYITTMSANATSGQTIIHLTDSHVIVEGELLDNVAKINMGEIE